MHRRTFLKLCGLAAYGFALGFGTTNCSYAPPADTNWAVVPNFSINEFNDWFIAHKLYNPINANLILAHISGFYSCFSMSVFQGVSPGMDYSSNKMYAVAEGYVYSRGKINTAFTGRLGGNYLEVAHPGNFENNDFKAFAFLSQYAHLGKIYVQTGDKVERGQLLADVEYHAHAKLMFSRGFNWIDPDNFGVNHGLMDYWDEKTNLEVHNLYDKRQKQREIIIKLSDSVDPKLYINHDVMLSKEHRPVKQGKFCRWDDVEIMRYLDELYKARPQSFPNLSAEEFTEYKIEFYANQPIVLTLPLKP
jgi:hypothetical protein